MTRPIGPRVSHSSGPRVTGAQPGTPPTTVQLGQDRLLAGAREVDIGQLRPDPEQPRKEMQPEPLRELAASITAYGVLQPLVVRQDTMGPNGDMAYTIIAGGRRYAAIQLALREATDEEVKARLARVPVVVTETPEAQHRILQLVENLQREDLNPVEEARALRELMALQGLSMERVAASIHRSHGYIDERLRLLRHEEISAAVEAGSLTKSAAAAIASISSASLRAEWLDRARRGEVVRPKDIYASKPDRRVRLPRATLAPAPQPGRPDVEQDPAQPGRPSGDPDPARERAGSPTGSPGDIAAAQERTLVLGAAYALLMYASPAEKTLVQRLLYHGAHAGMTCQDLLAVVKRVTRPPPW